MTYNYHHGIDRLIKENKLYRFKSELSDTTDETRINALTKLINLYEAHKDEKQIKDDILKAHLKVLNDSQYQKKWQFFNSEQKMNRINEYIERTEIKDNNIITFLKNGINDNKLKSKDIKYDNIKCHIVSINIPIESSKK